MKDESTKNPSAGYTSALSSFRATESNQQPKNANIVSLERIRSSKSRDLLVADLLRTKVPTDVIEYADNLERDLASAHADNARAISQLDDALGRLQQAHARIAELEAERERLRGLLRIWRTDFGDSDCFVGGDKESKQFLADTDAAIAKEKDDA